jgi:hypothetical protein
MIPPIHLPIAMIFIYNLMFHIEPAHARQSVQAPLLSLNRSLQLSSQPPHFSTQITYNADVQGVSAMRGLGFIRHISPS